MPDISSAGGPQSPQTPKGGPFEPLQIEFRGIRTALGLLFDDPDEMVREFYERVLSLPPEERFTTSIETLRPMVEERAGSLEAAKAILPLDESDGHRLNRRMLNVSEQLIDRVLGGVWEVRQAELIIGITGGLAAIWHGFDYMESGVELPKEDRKQILSSTVAFMARLVREGGKDAEEYDPEQVLRDAAYTLHYIEDLTEDEESEREFPNPDAVDSEIARQKLREYGAIIAYQRLDISVGRGAELADLSRFEFEELLEEHDIAPRYGPDSADGLEDGVGMIDE